MLDTLQIISRIGYMNVKKYIKNILLIQILYIYKLLEKNSVKLLMQIF